MFKKVLQIATFIILLSLISTTTVMGGITERSATLESLALMEEFVYVGNSGSISMEGAAKPSILYKLTDGKPKNDNGVIGLVNELVTELAVFEQIVDALAADDHMFLNSESEALTGFTFFDRLEALNAKLDEINTLLPDSEINNINILESTIDATDETIAEIDEAIEDFTKPTVVSTTPANGETDVSRDLEWISVTFSEEMSFGHSVSSFWDAPGGEGWPLSYETPLFWSDDMMTFHISRDNAGVLLSPGVSIEIVFNPTTHGSGFRDTSGNTLEEFRFTFTVEEEQPEGVILFAADFEQDEIGSPPSGSNAFPPDVNLRCFGPVEVIGPANPLGTKATLVPGGCLNAFHYSLDFLNITPPHEGGIWQLTWRFAFDGYATRLVLDLSGSGTCGTDPNPPCRFLANIACADILPSDYDINTPITGKLVADLYNSRYDLYINDELVRDDYLFCSARNHPKWSGLFGQLSAVYK